MTQRVPLPMLEVDPSLAPGKYLMQVGSTHAVTGLVAPDPATGTASRLWLEAIPIKVYGHSYAASPGQACTSGAEFFNRVKARAFAPSATSYGKGGGRAVETFFDLLNQNTASANVGSTWAAGTKAVALVDTETNDFACMGSAGTYYQTMTARGAKQVGWAVRGALAVLTAAARIESSAGTFSGTWTTSSLVRASGGTFSYTTQPGAYIDIPVTITSAHSGTVHLLLFWSTAAGATAEIKVDGVVNQTINPGSPAWESVYSGRSGAANPIDNGIQPVKISGLAVGSHTIRVTHAGASGTFLDVDCVLIAAQNPVPVVYYRDPTPLAIGGRTAGNVTTWQNNKTLCNPDILAALADFPTVTAIDHGSYLDAASLSYSDGIHPNDRGMKRIAAATLDALAASTYDPDAMYATL